jgi:hypothetical protein
MAVPCEPSALADRQATNAVRLGTGNLRQPFVAYIGYHVEQLFNFTCRVEEPSTASRADFQPGMNASASNSSEVQVPPGYAVIAS